MRQCTSWYVKDKVTSPKAEVKKFYHYNTFTSAVHLGRCILLTKGSACHHTSPIQTLQCWKSDRCPFYQFQTGSSTQKLHQLTRVDPHSRLPIQSWATVVRALVSSILCQNHSSGRTYTWANTENSEILFLQLVRIDNRKHVQRSLADLVRRRSCHVVGRLHGDGAKGRGAGSISDGLVSH